MLMLALGVAGAGLAAITVYAHWHRGVFRTMGVPVAPTIPFLGVFHTYLKLPSVFDADTYHLKKYGTKDGKLVGIFDGRTPVLLVADAEMIRAVVQKQSSDFYDRVCYLDEDPSLFRLSLINLRGAHWKHIRQVMTPTFTPNNLRRMMPLIEECSHLLVDDLGHPIKDDAVDVRAVAGRFSLRAIASIAFGIDLKNSSAEDYFVKATADVFSFFDSPIQLFIFAIPHVTKAVITFFHTLGIQTSLVRSVNTLAGLVTSEIYRRRKENVSRNDFLQSMMALEETAENSKDINKRTGLTRDEIIAQCVLFLVAGYETTASTLVFFCISMAQNLDCQDKLRKELGVSELGAAGAEITADRLASLRYLEMCLYESMRFYPAIFRTDRVCTAPGGTTLCGIHIPQGLAVGIPIQTMHELPEFWPEPEKFDPLRFTDGIPPSSAFAFLPFGAGPHNCIGERLAKLELKMAIASIFRKYRVELSSHTSLPVKISQTGLRTPIEPVYLRFIDASL